MLKKLLAPLLIIVGLLLLYQGFTSFTSDSVHYRSVTMQAGDRCREYSRKRGVSYNTIHQQRDSDRILALMMLRGWCQGDDRWHGGMIRGYRREP